MGKGLSMNQIGIMGKGLSMTQIGIIGKGLSIEIRDAVKLSLSLGTCGGCLVGRLMTLLGGEGIGVLSDGGGSVAWGGNDICV